jgi:mannose-1-phosphate guanylyltransferase
MRALLLAAGRGERLRPLTNDTPKCLIEIAGRPLIDYWLAELRSAGIQQVIVNTHYLADKIAAHLDASPLRNFIEIVHEPALLGTGGTVIANRRLLGDGPFLVIHADNLSDLSVTALVAAHAKRTEGCAITMATFVTDRPRDCGIVETDRNGVVVAFHEKVAEPPGFHANAAVYVFEPEVVDFIAALGSNVIDLSTEVIPYFLGRIQTHAHPGYHRDIGTPESLSRARSDLAAGAEVFDLRRFAFAS